MSIHTKIQQIAQEFHSMDITAFFVGGCVRDEQIGIDSDDIDVCLVGVKDKNLVTTVLSRFSSSIAEEVGNSFPVWIVDIDGHKIDFALARAEKKIDGGTTRRDFVVVIEDVTIEEDLMRRDLTINAVAKHCITGELVDPFGGIHHIKEKVAHLVSDAFEEDSLRVLRAARFCARFGLEPTKELLDTCRFLEPADIPAERVGMELKKLMEQAEKPSIFFRFLKEVDWLKFHFKELEALIGVQQDPNFHPEGDCFEHSMHCLDQATDPFIRLSMLCHDLGKATTTIFEDGRWKAPGHEKAGVEPATNMLTNLKHFDKNTIEQVALMVELHMVHIVDKISNKFLKKILRRLHEAGLTFDQLVEVCRCDVSGRPPKPGFTPNIRQEDAADMILKNEVECFVTGKKLIALGMKPGKEFGVIIAQALELQDDGILTQENWLEVLRERKIINL